MMRYIFLAAMLILPACIHTNTETRSDFIWAEKEYLSKDHFKALVSSGFDQSILYASYAYSSAKSSATIAVSRAMATCRKYARDDNIADKCKVEYLGNRRITQPFYEGLIGEYQNDPASFN